MGSPDPRQIDGIGGGDPLSSKVAVVFQSARDGIDVDYLFLQVFVDENRVSDAQNCGNVLAGVGPFAIERGLVEARMDETLVRIFMQKHAPNCDCTCQHPERPTLTYSGDARIDGVPGTSAAIPITFQDTAGSSCGALFPSGQPKDTIDGIDVTMIDNGMPCVLMRAADLGLLGSETPSDLEVNAPLRARIEAHSPDCRHPHEPRRCRGQNGPENDDYLGPNKWRGDQHAHVHSPFLSQGHWCAWRCQHSYGLLHKGHRRGWDRSLRNP